MNSQNDAPSIQSIRSLSSEDKAKVCVSVKALIEKLKSNKEKGNNEYHAVTVHQERHDR